MLSKVVKKKKEKLRGKYQARLLPNGNPDVKWKLTTAEAGNYKVILNTKDVTVTFQKQ